MYGILLIELNIGDTLTLGISQTIGKHNSSWGKFLQNIKTEKEGVLSEYGIRSVRPRANVYYY
jgi:hypothetical protein